MGSRSGLRIWGWFCLCCVGSGNRSSVWFMSCFSDWRWCLAPHRCGRHLFQKRKFDLMDVVIWIVSGRPWMLSRKQFPGGVCKPSNVGERLWDNGKEPRGKPYGPPFHWPRRTKRVFVHRESLNAAHSLVYLTMTVPSSKYLFLSWSRWDMVGAILTCLRDFTNVSWNVKCCFIFSSVIVVRACSGRKRAVFWPVKYFKSALAKKDNVFFSTLDCQVRNDLFHWGPQFSYNIKKGVFLGSQQRRCWVYWCLCVVFGALSRM